jgi:hypothetical protein
MSWNEYDDLVEQEKDKAKNRIKAAREAVDRVQYISSLLGGKTEGYVGTPGVPAVIGAVNGLLSDINVAERRSRENQLTLQSLLAAPNGIELDYQMATGRLVGNNLTFSDIAAAALQDQGVAVRDEERGYFDEIKALWAESQEIDSDAERATIAKLEPQLSQLESDDPTDQVGALAELNPGALAGLEPPTGYRSEEAVDQIAAFESYEAPAVEPEPAAPVTSPPAAVDPVTRPPGEYGKTPLPPSQPRGPLGQQDLAGLRDIDPESSAGQRLQSAFSEMDFSTPETPGPPGPPGLTAAEIRDANQTEVERILAEQFGGFSFFLRKNESELQVGLTADGRVVEADDPEATTVKNILDVIVEQGIVAPELVRGLVQKTEWWQTTDARMREYDVLTADMSEPEKLEYLEPVLDKLRDEAQFLGFQLDENRARFLAEDITRMGEETDSEYIRGLLTDEDAFNSAQVAGSSFAAARNEIMAMSRRYFTPISEADAAQYAEDIYVGRNTAEGVEDLFRDMAAHTMPQLQNVLDAGYTPEQYFAPYKYEIERMLDRPNIDLYEEFGDVIQHIPDGGGQARPMTLGELRRYVRGLPEWQQSTQGKDSARALAFAIGKTFGEVA